MEAKLVSDKVKFNGIELKKVFHLFSNKDKEKYKPATWDTMKLYYEYITDIMKQNINNTPTIKGREYIEIVSKEPNRINNKIVEKLKKGGSPMTAIL